MLDMPRPRPPYLRFERTRHGKIVWYVRKDDGPRIRIRGEYGTAEFMAAYDVALRGETSSAPKVASGTLAWLIEQYQESGDWAKLSPASQSQRRNIFKVVCKTAGAKPYTSVTRQAIVAGRDRRKETPFAANDFLKAMRGLFAWATPDYVKVNPTDGVEGLGHATAGFHVWCEDEVAAFEARWPIGTRERMALAILLYTGLRRGDAARLGRQHVKNGTITLRTEKTGAVVTLPILPQLAEVIDATKTGDMAFVSTMAGGAMTKESFGNWFRDACRAAGVPGTAHGLRKLGATRAANNGATEAELEALFGWRGGRMASLYTRNANRAKLARGAVEKMAGQDEKRTSIAAPSQKVQRTDGLGHDPNPDKVTGRR